MNRGTTALASYFYTHKPTGQRASVTQHNGRRVEYDYNELWQVTRAYTHGHAPIGQRPTVGQPSFFQHDGGTHTRQLSDTNGAITDSYDYDAYGLALGQTGSTPNDYRYRGEQYDAEQEAYNLRYRYYRPASGRFNTYDPFGGYASDPKSLHRYAYVGADPVNYIDPLGLASLGDYNINLSAQAGKASIALRNLSIKIACSAVRTASEIAQSTDPVIQVVQKSGIVELIFCKCKKGQRPSTRGNNPTENNLAGNALADDIFGQIADGLAGSIYEVIREEGIKTPFGWRRSDILIKDGDKNPFLNIEVKLGKSRYKHTQRGKDRFLRNARKIGSLVIRHGGC